MELLLDKMKEKEIEMKKKMLDQKHSIKEHLGLNKTPTTN
jgi:hypothetical protein